MRPLRDKSPAGEGRGGSSELPPLRRFPAFPSLKTLPLVRPSLPSSPRKSPWEEEEEEGGREGDAWREGGYYCMVERRQGETAILLNVQSGMGEAARKTAGT